MTRYTIIRGDNDRERERERLRRWRLLPAWQRGRLERLLHGEPAESDEDRREDESPEPGDLPW